MSFVVFGHRYSVQLLDKVYDQTTLEVDFKIQYDDRSKTNSSKIVLWNLSPKTLNSIKVGTPIVLSGGWPGSSGIIFTGEVTRISTEAARGADTATEIFVSQDRDLWFKSSVNKEWKGPVKTLSIVKEIIADSGFSEGFIDESITFAYKRNWSFNGKLKDALIELANDCGARSYNEGGRMFFMLPGKSVIQTIEVPSEHILVSPRSTTKGNWKFESILRWEARPGTVVNLKSKYLKGSYTALSVEHVRTGDNKFVTRWEVSDGTGGSTESKDTDYEQFEDS